jgi:hypothetical protein
MRQGHRQHPVFPDRFEMLAVYEFDARGAGGESEIPSRHRVRNSQRTSARCERQARRERPRPMRRSAMTRRWVYDCVAHVTPMMKSMTCNSTAHFALARRSRFGDKPAPFARLQVRAREIPAGAVRIAYSVFR